MFKYDPHLKTENEIRTSFISGSRYLESIMADLTPDNGKLSNQCVLITGKRGIGKSHFLRMLYFCVIEDQAISNSYLPILFPEELFNVNSLYHLLKDAIDRIFSELRKKDIAQKTGINELMERYGDVLKVRFKGSKKEQIVQREKTEQEMFTLLKDISRVIGKKFIFLLENLNELFKAKLTKDELKRLRAFLQQNNETLLIIATSLSVFDRVEKYGEAFYNFFQFRNLAGISSEEVIVLLKAEARIRGNGDINKQIERYRGEIEVFRILTGGNPRLCLLLYDLLAEKEDLVTEDILKKITEMTPYFKAVTETFSPAKQMIVDALCEGPPAQTPSEIAGFINEQIGIVNENLKRLSEDGMVEIMDTRKGKGLKKSETFYRIKDYLYRIWYQVRRSVAGDEDISWMAELMALLFRETELKERLKSAQTKLRPVYEYALNLVADKNYVERMKWLSMADIEDTEDAYNREFVELSKKEAWQDIIKKAEGMIMNGIILEMAYYYKGFAYYSVGDHKKAIEAYQKALEINPDNYMSWNSLGNNIFSMGDYKGAIKAYKKAVKIKPDDYASWENMGLSYLELENYEKAVYVYKKSLIINPDEHESWTNLGYCYGKLEDYEKAIDAYKNAVDKKPDIHQPWFNLGYSYGNLKNHEKSIEAYKKAVDIKPDDYESWYNMGNSHAELGENEEGIGAYRKHAIYARSFPEFTFNAYRKIKEACINLFEKEKDIKVLTSADSSLEEKTRAIGELVCLDQLNQVEAIILTIFKEMEQADSAEVPQQELKVLYFYLMFETILRLKERSKRNDPLIAANYLLRTIHLLQDNRQKDEKVREFVINYVLNTEGSDINKEGLFEIFNEWESMDEYIPESIHALIEAVEDPDSRTAQVWSADPLFKEVLKKLSDK